MTTRRAFLAGATAALSLPVAGWAEVGDPAFLSAARQASGAYALYGLSAGGEVRFSLPLPARGHAAAAHPHRAEAVAFARRPGFFALVIDCRDGRVLAQLDAPSGRHFYGHGVFSRDGALLFTTENDLETLEGRIGIWDAANGYARIGDIPSGGIGPHDIARLPDSDLLVIANGGIATHPDSGRMPLNSASMRGNLAYISADGALVERVELDIGLRQNSIRHLSLRADGLVAAAMQWEGSAGRFPPLLLTHRLGDAPRLLGAPEGEQRRMRNYAGSVGFSRDGQFLAITSPRGGQLHRFDAATGDFLSATAMEDVCGLAATAQGFLVTTGLGHVAQLADEPLTVTRLAGVAWDNHLIAIG
ncbi:DUF1513 domain-containing protein [Pararhodobacter oceanensis]|uniref:DUF1513 domain-containing protein n=1 Tax=Pararhodobacter oceanensis TaxID=2172121 RepID=A0A2T8HPU1_9RHOB|nr:DUF1513 domain-containing protein [Pararhodobacter oceanensis]PVH27461.1 DUF1513 domain-containing protein [Pararhodobacter oceanensis]